MMIQGWRLLFASLLLFILSLHVSAETAESSLLSTTLISSESIKHPQSSLSSDKAQFSEQYFNGLNDAVLFYEGLQQSGLWQSIETGPLLKRGEFHQQIATLRNQLVLLGDLSPLAISPLFSRQFDAELEVALKHFQARHSLKADGVLGAQTRNALNVPPWQRIDQLVLNIHRQRQLSVSATETYVHVNLPEYRLRVYTQGDVVLEMKAIIGKRKRQTPVFSATVRQVVINPSWNVPKSIAFKDIIPRWQQDEGYLEKHNLQVLAGWTTPRTFVQDNDVDFNRLYQGESYQRFWEPPGENNTLGRVKFPLTSKNSIYLHDTSARHLFDVEKRAFSSGCIRLEKPRVLADMLLELSNQWRPELLDTLFERQETKRVRLETPIPVHITYWTAWLNQQGELNFSNDPYQRDAEDFVQLQDFQQQEQNQQVKLIPVQVGLQAN
ncbi:MAG: L,D-transpeptidase family protein [Pseudomonadales bacterium]